jgi:hypothetical protein
MGSVTIQRWGVASDDPKQSTMRALAKTTMSAAGETLLKCAVEISE